jgi:hypothetical protein
MDMVRVPPVPRPQPLSRPVWWPAMKAVFLTAAATGGAATWGHCGPAVDRGGSCCSRSRSVWGRRTPVRVPKVTNTSEYHIHVGLGTQ